MSHHRILERRPTTGFITLGPSSQVSRTLLEHALDDLLSVSHAAEHVLEVGVPGHVCACYVVHSIRVDLTLQVDERHQTELKKMVVGKNGERYR